MEPLFESYDPRPVLGANAAAADALATWPTASWEALRQAGVTQWCLPTAHGGQARDRVRLLQGYEALAGACLTTAFILSQREAGCRRLRDLATPDLQAEVLPPLAHGEWFTTVGLSHLTTSRQYGPPAVRVRADGEGFTFSGVTPWVTGAARANVLVCGGTMDDGKQLLAAIFQDQEGVKVGPPMDLMALAGSMTAEVHLNEVNVPRRQVLAGPSDRILMQGKSDSGGLETSCLALGLTSAATAYLENEARLRPELQDPARLLESTRQTLRQRMLELAKGSFTAEQAAELRGQANALVLRATQAALTASKGAGFLRDHPAQRWARQALFFLVWSCPRPAADATLAFLTPTECELTL
jgi:alkylation response protein AidB-like acyl-CoA dehydrogenase